MAHSARIQTISSNPTTNDNFMLSYQHAFHAGNHADVIKHLCLTLCCEHMSRKEKPFCYLDTHAGAGMYDLKSESAQKNQEYQSGITKLTTKPSTLSVPSVFDNYLKLVDLSRKSKPHSYPGSPWFAAQLTRPGDQLFLYEQHPKEFDKLARLFARDKRVKVTKEDGFLGLTRTLPPASRRGITLIDPPYEQASEYPSVLSALQAGIKRFGTGVYIVWYPLINRATPNKSNACEKMIRHIKTGFNLEQLHLRFTPNPDIKGMYGSGLAIINPPWGLKEQMETALKFLCLHDPAPNCHFESEFRTFNPK